MTQRCFSSLCPAIARHRWPFKRASEAEMRVVLLDWAALNQEMKSLCIYSHTAVVPLLSGTAVSLPPRLRAGWAQHRHPQTEQTSHFSFIVSIWRSHCCWALAIVIDYGAIVEIGISFKVEVTGLDCFKEWQQCILSSWGCLIYREMRGLSLCGFALALMCRHWMYIWMTVTDKWLSLAKGAEVSINQLSSSKVNSSFILCWIKASQ